MVSRTGGRDVIGLPSVHVIGAFDRMRESGRSPRRDARLQACLTERSLDLFFTPLVNVIGNIQWFRQGTRQGPGRRSLPGRVVARSEVSPVLQ